MQELISGKILLYNIETGQHEAVDVLRGESAYEAAVRLGYTKLSEAEWLKEYDTKRDQAIADIVAKGEETLATIPEDYTTLNNNVTALTEEMAEQSKRFKNLNIEGYDYQETYVDDLTEFEKTAGKFWRDEGYEAESALWDYYSKPVNAGESYHIKTDTQQVAKACYYLDSAGIILESYPAEIQGSLTEYEDTVTAPPGAAKLIVNARSSGVPVIEKQISGYKSDGILESEVAKNTEKLNSIERYGEIVASWVDVRDTFSKIVGKMYKADGETTDTALWNYYRKDVEPGDTYTITAYAGQVNPAYAVLDKNNDFVDTYPKPLPGSNAQYTGEITIPENGAHLVVNEWAATPSIIEKKVNVSYFRAKTVLTGKALAACGDSITEGRNPDGGFFQVHAELVAERNGMDFYKDGIGGSTMANVAGHNSFSVNRYLNVPEYDYLLLWFGWNDGAYSELGTINDTDNTTFYGAYKMVLNYFITTHPTKKIGLIVPYMSNEGYQQAVRDVSKMYGVPCLDLSDGNSCSLLWGVDNDAQLARRAALTYDGTHPNQDGHYYLSTMIEAFLLGL